MIRQFKNWLLRLSFRTGIMLIILCIVCYIISFAQMLLPISITTKGVLWVVFFGLAKTFQYSGLVVIGVDGINRLKIWWKNKKNKLKL